MNAIRMMLAQGRMAAPAIQEADVAFAWDGATWDVGEYDNGFFPVTLTLTLGGVPITDDVMFILFLNKTIEGDQYREFTEDIYFGTLFQALGTGVLGVVYKGTPIVDSIDMAAASINTNYYLRVMLPTGALVSSEALNYDGGGPG